MNDAAAQSQAPVKTLTDWRLALSCFIVAAVLGLWPLFAHAGGLGLAPLMAIAGLLAFLTAHPSGLIDLPEWGWALALTLVWLLLSSLWSPYDDPQPVSNVVKIAAGALVYSGALLAFNRVGRAGVAALRHLAAAMCVFSAGLLALDMMSGFGLTHMIDPLNDGEDPVAKAGDIEMNVGHGIAVLTLAAVPAAALMMRCLRIGFVVAPIFLAVVFAVTIKGGLSAGTIALLAGSAAGFIGLIMPATTVRTMTWLAIFSVLAAPLLGHVMGFVSDDMKAALPFSWEHRAEMWTYVSEKILEAPLWGHGFDASRTFDATFDARGFEGLSTVSLHPHNAGLQIWVETGLIGAALVSLTLLAMGSAAEYFADRSRFRSAAIAGFMAAAIVINATTFGIWQEWWQAAMFLVGGMVLLVPGRVSA